jgi:hypothetical protein
MVILTILKVARNIVVVTCNVADILICVMKFSARSEKC